YLRLSGIILFEKCNVFEVSKIITKFACWSTQHIDEKSLNYFFGWLLEKLQQPNNEYLQTVARNLQMLLRVRDYRNTFVTKQGVDVLIKVLSNKETNCELYYQLIFCLWCLSFNANLVQVMVKNPTLLPAVCDVFCDAEREKVLRICMAFLRSVLEKLDDPAVMRECSLRMVQCKALKRLELLSQKDLSHDPEMTEDLKFLQETLKASVQDVSSLEEYTTELTSGRLEWSPVHKSEKFWRENAVKFTENNYELLKMLVYLMESSTEAVILSVAAHDVGEFVRHYPRGKQVIDQLGGKQVVMSLLQHHDPSVRYNALLALQKIMVHNWEYLGKQLETQKTAPSASSTSTAKVK
ncbi:V-type proton ATPase subunit H, partial [Taenia solium]